MREVRKNNDRIVRSIIAGLLFLFSSLHLYGQNDTLATLVKNPVEGSIVDLGIAQVEADYSFAASSQISSDHRWVSSFDQLLQGGGAGMQVVQNSGQPGASLSVRIRGIRTLAAGAEPLYIIDGIPIYNNNSLVSSGFAFGPTQNGLGFLDPTDIASINVLKDAAATSLYGARASNGVVVIRTRRGTKERSGLSLLATVGVQTPIGSYDLANAKKYAGFMNRANVNAGLPPLYSSPDDFGTGTDWQSQITRDNALLQKYHLSFDGGSEKVRFFVSGSYANTDGLIKGSSLERLNFRANIDADLNDKISLHNSLNFGRIDANTLPTDDSGGEEDFGVISSAYQFSPLIPAADADDRLIGFNYKVNDDGTLANDFQGDFALPNPLAMATAIDSRYASTRINDVLSLKLNLAESLDLSATLGLDAIYNDESTFLPGVLQFDVPLGGIGSSAKMQSIQWFNQYLFNYRINLPEKHELKIMAGYSQEGYRREILGGQSTGFENEALSFYSLAVGKNKRVLSNLTRWSLQSYLGNLNYTFDDRFALQVSGRTDASSRFDNSFEIFPTVSLAWFAHEASFVKSSDLISGFSLKANYGVTGNQEIPPYSSFTFLDEFNAPLNGATINGISLARIGNEALEMERTNQWNIGMDIGLWRDNLLITLALYGQDTKNAILFAPLPATSGFGNGLINGAEISNNGLEITMSCQQTWGKFKWRSGFSLGYNRNEIKALPDDQDVTISAEVLDLNDWSIMRVGQSIGTFYGFETAGLATENDPAPAFAGQNLQDGDQKYRDTNGDGIISGADRVILGSANPTIDLGYFNQLDYGAFELSFLWQGLLGREVINVNRLLLENPTGRNNILLDFATGSPSLPSARNIRRQGVLSDAIVEDGSYLRLQDIRLTYQVSDKLINKLPFADINIFISGQNILTLTSYSGVDPDVSHFGQQSFLQGVDFGGYPKAKSFMGGIKVDF